MKTIPIELVKVPEKRQRTYRSQQDHQDLFVSISEGEAGLLHAPVLWKEGEVYWLLVGEGRLNVIQEMYELGLPLRYEGKEVEVGHIPYTLVGDVSKVGLAEAEFDENVRRTPLSVAERASATAMLFELKKLRAEAEGKPEPTVKELSMDIRGASHGYYGTETTRELIVAKHLEDPEVRNAPTIREAFNVIKKKETQRKAEAITKEVGGQMRGNRTEMLHADAMEWIDSCPDAIFDIVLTDPPYGMGADDFGDASTATSHRYVDSYESWRELMTTVIPQLGRICKPDAHLYLFCDFDRFGELKEFLLREGWTVHRTPLIWHNPVGFRTPWPDSGPQRKYECILYAKRGEKKCLKVMPDVLTYTREKESVHQAQKPVALLKDLLSRSALPTDVVLDFCSGGGSTGIACHEMKLACTCIEKHSIAYGAGVKRLQDTLKG